MEAAAARQFWPTNGQLARIEVFKGWEDRAGDAARKVQEGMEELDRAVCGFAGKFGVRCSA